MDPAGGGETRRAPWARLGRLLRPMIHAGVPAGLSRSQERELIVGNVVILFSIAVTLPDVVNYFRFDNLTTRYAGICAASATAVYVLGFVLVALGRRWLGIFLFTAAVLANLFLLTLILGTGGGTQYFFIAVGVGGMFVWPQAHRRMRVPVALAGVALFVAALHFARPEPLFGPALPAAALGSIFQRQTLGAYAIVFALALYALSATERAERALEAEHEKSEALLLNILPQAVAARLKESPGLIADSFDSVSILFADVVGFTPMSDGLAPAQVVDFLNELFSRFDALAERHGLEKIKTIGDAYMVASGIPSPRADHAQAIAAMALEMLEVVSAMRDPRGRPVQMRIGIASGPAIAGVIGARKFAYDIWGDTVNTAARMESNGPPGMVQVTETTQQLLAGAFDFEARGTVDIKGKGPMRLFLMTGRRAG